MISDIQSLHIKVLHEPTEEDPFVVINKPHNFPSAPLNETDTCNALYEASLLYPEINLVQGRKPVEKGLIHRLDTVTSGLILIATNQTFYDRMLQLQSEDKFIKYYRAHCNVLKENGELLGAFPGNEVNIEMAGCNDIVYTKSYFRPYGEGQKEVRPVTESSGKAALKKVQKSVEYSTEIKIIEKNKQNCSVICKITRGYRHQVRCHLAWAGIPVMNDPLYNASFKNSEQKESSEISFEACAIEFPHPFDLNRLMRFEI